MSKSLDKQGFSRAFEKAIGKRGDEGAKPGDTTECTGWSSGVQHRRNEIHLHVPTRRRRDVGKE